MKILVINAGSSSIKYRLYEMPGEALLANGIVDRIGQHGSSASHCSFGRTERTSTGIAGYPDGMASVLDFIVDKDRGVIKSIDEIDAVGHRVVHGGERFRDSVLVDDVVLEAMRRNSRLAPLHNPHNILGIEICQGLLPRTPGVAVFDTALHQTMPPRAFLYGLPAELHEKHGIRKYGFHGTSHWYVAREAATVLGKPFESLKIITCHLGNGASITAFDRGRSIDTSMGFTPLEGLVMGTRCGDIDASVVIYLQEVLGFSLKEVAALLNEKSGLKGLCGKSDMRDIEELAGKGDKKAQTAVDVFVYRVQKYIGAYLAALNGVHALVFTGGIGENSPYLRGKILSAFSFIGLKIDSGRNAENQTIFSAGDSAVHAMAVATNEELVIARQTYEVITRKGRAVRS